MAKARHESQLDIGSFAHGEISLRCIFAFVCTSQHLTSHPQMLLHVVCHSYSCIAMCTAWLLTGHRAVALPHFGSWYPVLFLCNHECITLHFHDILCAPMAEPFICLCKTTLQGLHHGLLLRSQQRTQAWPSHKSAQHRLRALLLSLHSASSGTNSKLMCCSSPGRKQTAPMQHHA